MAEQDPASNGLLARGNAKGEASFESIRPDISQEATFGEERTGSAKEPIASPTINIEADVWTDARIRNIILPKSADPLQYIGEPRKTLAYKDRKRRLPDEWMNRSTAIALADGRGLITAPHAMIHAGHGNAQFVLAGVVALARRFNLIPVIPCRKFGKLHTSPFFNFHCVDTRYVKWRGLGDGTASNFGLGYQNEIRFRANNNPPIHTSINGYMQMYSAFGFEKDTVCWAQRPDEETQKNVMKYWNEVVVANVTEDMTEHTSIVAVHVRRGDYISDKKKELHGALSVQYYRDSWNMIMGRIGLSDNTVSGDVVKNVIVLVFAASNSIDWARDHLEFPGARRVQFVTPNQGGRGPAADIDILALGLADYYILANSTFCWWAHFYASCRRMFDNWWLEKWDQPRRKVKTTAVALPHRWHKGRFVSPPCPPSFCRFGFMLTKEAKSSFFSWSLSRSCPECLRTNLASYGCIYCFDTVVTRTNTVSMRRDTRYPLTYTFLQTDYGK